MQHLSEQELARLKALLTQREQALRGEIRDELLRSDEEQYAELAGQVHDSGDDALADLLVDLNVSRVGTLIRDLREVEAALVRMAEGSYGVCEDGEEEIPFARLEVYPTARRCVEHQQRREATYAEEGRPKL